jgi:hypothetical protein
MSFSIYLALFWITLGIIYLHRAYAGALPGGMMSLNHSQPAILGRKQRWARVGFGICFWGLVLRVWFCCASRSA